jgi:hypothetical protein
VITLGQTGRDVITGFEGVCLGKAQYLTGCNQVLLTPTSLAVDGKRRDGEWFDEQRVVPVGEEVLSLPGGSAVTAQAPGRDESLPPSR